MHSAVLLASQNELLTAENHRQKRKRAKGRTYVAKGGVLTGAEAQGLIDKVDNRQGEAEIGNPVEARQRALPRCSLCSSLEHKAPKCPGLQGLV